MKAVIDLMADGKLPVEKLTTHRFSIENAPQAYELITSGKEPFFGVLLTYPKPAVTTRRVQIRKSQPRPGAPRVSLIGAGNFARLVMLPIVSRDPRIVWRGVCSARGMNAEQVGRQLNAAFVCTDASDVIEDPDTDAIMIMTRHDLHASQVIAALRAGKAVFVEKPLCIQLSELESISACIEELGEKCPVLSVGFNRRFARATSLVAGLVGNAAPLSIAYRFSAGSVPRANWTQDEEIGGGRIVGEACHAIDFCVALTKSIPIEVYAQSAGAANVETSDDRVFITMRHADGSVSNVSYQAGGDRAVPPERIEIFGREVTAIIDNWSIVDSWSHHKHSRVRTGKDKGHRAEFASFFTALDSGVWPIPWEQLYGTSWAALMAVESLRAGYPMRSY